MTYALPRATGNTNKLARKSDKSGESIKKKRSKGNAKKARGGRVAQLAMRLNLNAAKIAFVWRSPVTTAAKEEADRKAKSTNECEEKITLLEELEESPLLEPRLQTAAAAAAKEEADRKAKEEAAAAKILAETESVVVAETANPTKSTEPTKTRPNNATVSVFGATGGADNHATDPTPASSKKEFEFNFDAVRARRKSVGLIAAEAAAKKAGKKRAVRKELVRASTKLDDLMEHQDQKMLESKQASEEVTRARQKLTVLMNKRDQVEDTWQNNQSQLQVNTDEVAEQEKKFLSEITDLGLSADVARAKMEEVRNAAAPMMSKKQQELFVVYQKIKSEETMVTSNQKYMLQVNRDLDTQNAIVQTLIKAQKTVREEVDKAVAAVEACEARIDELNEQLRGKNKKQGGHAKNPGRSFQRPFLTSRCPNFAFAEQSHVSFHKCLGFWPRLSGKLFP